MNDERKASGTGQEAESSDPTAKSLKDGHDAMEIEKELTPGDKDKKEEKLKEDAEKWRNEG